MANQLSQNNADGQIRGAPLKDFVHQQYISGPSDPSELVCVSDDDNILGAGNFGYVLKGEFKNNPVAVKRQQREYYDEEEAIFLDELFAKEVTILYYLSRRTECFTKILGWTKQKIDGWMSISIVMELMDGNINDFIVKDTYRELHTQTNLMMLAWQMASAIEYLHKIGLAHNDVKAGNVLFFIDNRGMPKARIGDLGGVCVPDPNDVKTFVTPMFCSPIMRSFMNGKCILKTVDIYHNDIYGLSIIICQLFGMSWEASLHRINITPSMLTSLNGLKCIHIPLCNKLSSILVQSGQVCVESASSLLNTLDVLFKKCVLADVFSDAAATAAKK